MLVALAALAAAALSSDPPGPVGVAVFYAGLNGSKCFRIPTIIRTHKDTLLAFAENRVTDCGDNGAHHDLVVRRSHDLGKTWGPMIVVRHGTTPCPGCPAAISNPNPVEVTLPSGQRRVLLHYDTMNNPQPLKHGVDMQVWSDDDGVTWANASVLSFPPAANSGGLIGPSVGIQSKATGVIYFNVLSAGGGNKTMYWSKDYGSTWASSAPVQHVGSECSIAFLNDSGVGDILMNCRTGGGTRAQLRWTPEGVLKHVAHPPELIDPNCQGSLINHENTMMFSNANTTDKRANMAVKSSTDEGKTWSSGVSIWKGPSGYSQLVSLGGQGVGLLFEAGHKTTYETISYVAVPTGER